jgi:hypothetical protein
VWNCVPQGGELQLPDLEKTLTAEFQSFLKKEKSALRFFSGSEAQSYLSQKLKSEVQECLILQGQNRNEILTSISHTWAEGKNWVIAVGSSRRVGVDIEWAQRRMHPKVASWIISKEEKKQSLTPLAYWVMKEAAFKANPNNQGTVLSQYSLVSWDEKESMGQIRFPLSGDFIPCHCKLLHKEPWLIAFAVST